MNTKKEGVGAFDAVVCSAQGTWASEEDQADVVRWPVARIHLRERGDREVAVGRGT